MKFLVLLALVLFSTGSSYSQQAASHGKMSVQKKKTLITVTAASVQQWSGGTVGRRGKNYYISFTAAPNTIIPDTLWIGEDAYPVHIYQSKNAQVEEDNCHLFKGKTRWTYSIHVGKDESTYSSHGNGSIDNNKEEIKPKVPEYKGEAALSYLYNKKRNIEPIISFHRLEPINYP